MRSYESFGLPLPLVTENPYQVCVRRALEGLIAVPEGPLCWAASLIENWLKAVTEEYSLKGFVLEVKQSRDAPFRYKLRLLGRSLSQEDIARLIRLSEEMEIPAAPNLLQICQVLAANTAYVPKADMRELIEVFRDNLSSSEWLSLSASFAFLRETA